MSCQKGLPEREKANFGGVRSSQRKVDSSRSSESSGRYRTVSAVPERSAATRADEMNRACLADVVEWVRDNMPVSSYGSPAKVKSWLGGQQVAWLRSQYVKTTEDRRKENEL